MIKLKIIGFFIFSILIFVSTGQKRPPEIVPQLGEPTGPGVVTYINNLTPVQKAFYGKGKIKKEEYFLVDVPSEYISTVSYDMSLISSRHNKTSSLVTKHLAKTHLGLKYLGRFNESPNRVNDFYEGIDRKKMMLITWHFAADGASMRITTDSLNSIINKNRGNLSLTTSEKVTAALWKLSWNDAKTNYELFVEDELDARGEPLKKPKSIIALAENLVSN